MTEITKCDSLRSLGNCYCVHSVISNQNNYSPKIMRSDGALQYKYVFLLNFRFGSYCLNGSRKPIKDAVSGKRKIHRH